ncbi:hypothetical protein Pfo_026264 [Paulownia fortunei]|nr:hypothetical protein Pfo_026264 [Paulownia fortunei]
MSRLTRSSSMGGSADFLGRIKPVKPQPVASQEKKQAPAPTGQANAIKPVQNPVARKAAAPPQFAKQKQPPTAAVEKPRKRIFTFPSPPRGKDDRSRKGREDFLDACALCKKKIGQDRDRYMYGYLQAFCSPECRDDQIALDDEFNPPSPVRGQAGNFLKRNVLKVKFDK